MSRFEQEYIALNDDQKMAVNTTEGPLLVIAGPGTGKTQLLSMRIANILRKTDASAGNILCLTFTDNAARNMRDRLGSIIGQSAYHVSIHTFHSFGSDVINRYPEYFTKRQLLQQIDELGRYELLRSMFEDLPHSNPLSIQAGNQFIYLKDTLNAISWLKQNGVLPYELREILKDNYKFIKAMRPELSAAFKITPSSAQLDSYLSLLKLIRQKTTGKSLFGFPEYAAECAAQLESAIEATDKAKKHAKHITAWRNTWCKKDSSGKHVFRDDGQNYRKMLALANVYSQLTDEMTSQGLYDFDDMVVEAVHALENDSELLHDLQERYQYVLVDEFQDTNKAQLRMINSLGNNPVHENRPNIMAVGDDDQAIYSFQGAEVSNMAAFFKMFDDTKLVSLTDNYRSNEDILKASSAVSAQITDRLDSLLPLSSKNLRARKKYSENILKHVSFSSELSQYDWIASEIKRLIAKGVKPEDIAVIAPRHKYLERLMPYLGSLDVPVSYERRENILESPIIIQLITMSELVVSLAENRHDDVDELISRVLSYDFWEVPAEKLLDISLRCHDKNKHWMEILLKNKDKNIKIIAEWFLDLSKKSTFEPMEYMLDRLIGTTDQDNGVDRSDSFTSPLRAYYFNSDNYENHTDNYLTLLGQLSTLRHRLRQWKPNRTIFIKDLSIFSELHLAANLKIVDTNPHTQTTNAVQVMTAYKAKGLEFDVVFVINSQDEVWGPTARGQISKITLPKNLPIEPTGSHDNDKLRLLFVALTRAKHTLFLTGYTHTFDNKLSPPLSFIDGQVSDVFESEQADKPATPASVEILSTDWAYRFRQIIADKKTLFEPILANYKLSVTHLNNFLDVVDGGPDYFFIHNLLRFPEAISPSAAYGDSIHKTLQWVYAEMKSKGQIPTPAMVKTYLSDILDRKHLRKSDYKKLEERGQDALTRYIKERGNDFSPGDMVERGFNNEGVIIGEANLSGKIDKIHFKDSANVVVVDFKTGKPAVSWQGKDAYEKIKLHKYRQQLLFYKMLVENSASFRGRLNVISGELEFIEADDNGNLTDNLTLVYNTEELANFTLLVQAVWGRIMSLDFPDVKDYDKNLKGIERFEEDLRSRNDK